MFIFSGFLAARHCCFFFFFNDTATTEIYTLSLHDALPISSRACGTTWPRCCSRASRCCSPSSMRCTASSRRWRSEEHTSELQSQSNLVCRLLLEKKKTDEKRQPTKKRPHD